MYAGTVDAIKLNQPAHGHSQPLFGPLDPYLAAGKSIAPSARSLADMGVQKTSASEVSVASDGMAATVKEALSKGWRVMDGSSIRAETALPGFSSTGGILPHHDPRVPEETPETFAAQVEWSVRFLNVVDKIPYAAFLYAMVEFFLLRPNLDLYKEDVEEQPSRAFVETAVVTGVRVAAFALVAVLTLVMFG